MPRPKAPVYKDKGTQTCLSHIEELRRLCKPLAGVGSPENDLFAKLMTTLNDLESACKATIPLSRGGHHVGFGVDKTQRDITIATAMETLRQIKAVKAW